MAVRKMHQTTVRFGGDLWDALDEECARLGLSVAQYVREAALARLAYAAAKRGDAGFDSALELATGGRDRAEWVPDRQRDVRTPRASDAVERARVEVSESSALWAQGRQARRRAQELRDERARARRTG